MTAADAGRPRDPRLDEAILAATRTLLVELGPARTSIDAVAAAARTTKAAIYRRWSGKDQLVIAAIRGLYAAADDSDTGTLRGDLLACARHYARPDDSASRILARVLGETQPGDALRAEAYRAIGRPPADMLAAALDRAIARGDIAADAPLELVRTVLPAMALRSILIEGRALGDDTAVALVDDVLLPALRA